MTLSAELPFRPDAEQVRLKLGTAFIEHAGDLWPLGGTPSAEWIRDHIDDLLALLELPLRRDGRDVQRLRHRLHWLLWLLSDIDPLDS
jgi:hypothetical protein